METLIHADIFFFITSIFVIILTIFLIIGGVYLVRILRDFSAVSDKLKNAVNDVDEEVRELVQDVRESSLFKFVFGRRKSYQKKKSSHTLK